MKYLRCSDEIAKKMNKEVNASKRYNFTEEEAIKLAKLKGSKIAKSREEKTTEKEFVLSAWNQEGFMMDIQQYCEHYQLPREDIKEYKLVSHTGTPYYNIKFKETIESEVQNFDIEEIVKKHINPIKLEVNTNILKEENDFDMLTYTDVHIGMETNPDGKAMYSEPWDRIHALASCDRMIKETVLNQKSNTLVIDELGDFLDGYNQQTTRGGHALPQNMSNEEVFDVALEFKMRLIDNLSNHYESIVCNNICNDNHAGSFGYFVNKAFKDICSFKYPYSVEVNNYKKFINHYYMNNTCFVITHGKDESALKFGFKPQLDPKGIEKIDQYCKRNDIYKLSSKIVFKKGDSHQALFDMCSSDDFFYFNYPALSPSSLWVQSNFKKGRRGFVLESFRGENTHEIKPIFI